VVEGPIILKLWYFLFNRVTDTQSFTGKKHRCYAIQDMTNNGKSVVGTLTL
jgi:hypothetical protein